MIKRYWPEIILVIMTAVGIAGYAIGYWQIISLTPLYLLVNMALLYNRFKSENRVWVLWITAAVVGIVAEMIGVHTGLLFGEYTYGTVLGVMVWGVPLLVGLLWALVCSAIWSFLPTTLGLWRVPLVGVCAVVYDIALEHFATRFGLWVWQGSIPLTNALGWFLVSSLIALIFHAKGWTLPQSLIAKIILPVHTIFFIALLLL